MTTGTVVVLPNSTDQYAPVLAVLRRARHSVIVLAPAPGPGATHAARLCASLNALAPEPPVSLVAFGASALLLPSIALAQRAAHRRVGAYLLVEPVMPTVSDAWPDAPVTVLTDGEPGPAALRGWTVRPLADLAAWSPDA